MTVIAIVLLWLCRWWTFRILPFGRLISADVNCAFHGAAGSLIETFRSILMYFPYRNYHFTHFIWPTCICQRNILEQSGIPSRGPGPTDMKSLSPLASLIPTLMLFSWKLCVVWSCLEIGRSIFHHRPQSWTNSACQIRLHQAKLLWFSEFGVRKHQLYMTRQHPCPQSMQQMIQERIWN